MTCLYILGTIYHITSRDVGALSQQTNINKLNNLISLIKPIMYASKYKIYLIIVIKIVKYIDQITND